jgi:hypothetical protein
MQTSRCGHNKICKHSYICAPHEFHGELLTAAMGPYCSEPCVCHPWGIALVIRRGLLCNEESALFRCAYAHPLETSWVHYCACVPCCCRVVHQVMSCGRSSGSMYLQPTTLTGWAGGWCLYQLLHELVAMPPGGNLTRRDNPFSMAWAGLLHRHDRHIKCDACRAHLEGW